MKASYTLEILLVSYQNPTHMAQAQQTFRRGCCDGDRTLPCSPCDNAFEVCGRETITELVQGVCDLVEMKTGQIEADNDDLVFSTIGNNISGLVNPIVVTGDMWKVRVTLKQRNSIYT